MAIKTRLGAIRYNNRMDKIYEDAKQSFDTPHYRAAAYDLVMAAKDALNLLERLPDVDGADRVTCIQQLKAALKKAHAIPWQE